MIYLNNQMKLYIIIYFVLKIKKEHDLSNDASIHQNLQKTIKLDFELRIIIEFAISSTLLEVIFVHWQKPNHLC